MGMFDDIRCEAELPAGHPGTGRDFQTKSLGCYLARFTITKNGRLTVEQFRMEDDDEAPEPEPGSKLRFPRMKRVPLGEADTGFHGDIRFYDSVDGELFEYVARFTNGSLEWIRPWAEYPEILKSLQD